jgi:acylphosphatase
MQRKSYRFVVTGRVQGVFFRQSTRERALQLGLGGWVRNRADGAVEGEVTGADAAALEDFRTWLQRGPPRAQVSGLQWTPLEAADVAAVTGFEIRA